MNLTDLAPVLSVAGVVVAALVAAWAVRSKNVADAGKSKAESQSVIIGDLRRHVDHLAARLEGAEGRLTDSEGRLAKSEGRLAEVEAADRRKQALIERLIKWARRSWELHSEETRAELGEPPGDEHAATVVTTTTVIPSEGAR